MDKQQIFSRLQQLTGTLRAANKSTELDQLQRKLATALAVNPDLEITGVQSPHEAAVAETAIDLNKRYDHLSDLLNKQVLTGWTRGNHWYFGAKLLSAITCWEIPSLIGVVVWRLLKAMALSLMNMACSCGSIFFARHDW